MPLIVRDEQAGAYAELQARAGLGSFDLETVLAERGQLVDELAPLDAVVGPGGTKDADLKAYRAALAMSYREAWDGDGRLTEKALEQLVDADPGLAQKLEEYREMRARWVVLRHQVDAIDKRVQYVFACLRYAASEPK